MKKGLLIAGASVLLVSGLAAGVFAKYQSSFDANGSVVAKTWKITSTGDAFNDKGEEKLAPGESTNLHSFTLKNESEVDATLSGNFTLTDTVDDEIDYLTQLDVTLTGNTWTPVVGTKNSNFVGTLAKGAEITITLQIKWTDDGEGDPTDNKYSNQKAAWALNITATQA